MFEVITCSMTLQQIHMRDMSCLGSSKNRTNDQKDESRTLINEILDTLITFTDSSCHPNPGLCGAGACVYLPFETSPVNLKQPVSKHGSILLGEMIAIKMVLDFILEKLHQKRKLSKVLILSDSQSSVGLLTLGWEATQHKSTAKDVISKLELIKGKGIDIEIKWTPGHAEKKGMRRWIDLLKKHPKRQS